MTSTTQCVSIMTFSGRSLSGRKSELGVSFQTQILISSWPQDEDKFPEDNYTCEETIIEISVEKSRRRDLTKRCQKLEIDWQQVDEHLEGLSDLFSMGRKIILSMEFVYKEVACDSATAKGKKKNKSATEAQRLQRAAEAGLWTRVYEQYQLLPGQLEEIVGHIKETMKEGETEEDVDRKADGSIDHRQCKAHASSHNRCCDTAEIPTVEKLGDVEGDRQVILENTQRSSLS
ncbi:hypothetical protein DL98DRAFT_564632 [Cadophora sp. DSE1049]|nr:hypothetical protein DL98DRAFT_564632 [Cadophora sp. DSE1049]